MNEEMLRFEKMISIVVSKYENQYREDLKQDLYLYLFNSFQNKNFNNAKNLDNYIFICLKNQAKYEYRTKYCCPIDIVSLDKTNDITGSALIYSIPDNRNDEQNEEYRSSIPIDELKNRICEICGLGDYELLYRYYVDKVSQKELALKLQITQQTVSKRLKKIVKKLRKELTI